MKLRRGIASVVVALLLVLQVIVTPYVQAESAMKDSLVLAIGSEPEEGFDPVNGWGHYGTPLFHSTLVTYDRQFQLAFDLATSFEVDEAKTTYTFKLRDDVKFSDGSPLTAADVAFTYQTVKDTSTYFNLEKVSEIQVLDDNTVAFVLREPDSTFLNTVSSIGIFSERHYGKDYATQPIGTGPYQFVEWKKGEQLIVTQNPHYYGEMSPFKQLTFLFMEEEAALTAAMAQEIEVVAISHQNAHIEIPNMTLHALQTVDNRGVSLPYIPEQDIDGRKVGNNITSDKAIRQAMNIAIDRQMIADTVLDSYGKPAYSVADYMPWWNSESVIVDNNLEKAQQILSEAGWELNANGILEKEGVTATFNLLYPSHDALRESLAYAFSESVRPLGIEVVVEGQGWDTLEKNMYSNATLFGWGNNTPLEMYYLFSSQTKGYDFYNNNYYGNDTVDHYFKQALSATSEEEANKYWQLAQWDGKEGFATEQGDTPWIWLVNIDHLYFIHDSLEIGQQRIQPHGHGWPLTEYLTEWKVK